MAKPKADELNLTLNAYRNTINDTLQLSKLTPPRGQNKTNWKDVLEMSDHLSKQATIVGMLCTGEPLKDEASKETMESYVNALQGFLLHCHGSMVGAGHTLSSSIRVAVKQIVDSSFKLLQGFVSSLYGGSDKKPSIPMLTGAVWESCSNLKKVPTTNIKAIKRAMKQVVVSTEDVLREMQELKPASSYPESETLESSDDDNFGHDLSLLDLNVAKNVADIASDTLMMIKELNLTIKRSIKLEKPEDNGVFVNSLEKLLKLCQGIGVEIDELGACVYPPQELTLMVHSLERIEENVGEIVAQVLCFKHYSLFEPICKKCRRLESSVKRIECELTGPRVVPTSKKLFFYGKVIHL